MKINLPLVVFLAASVAACDTTETEKKTTQRDVYHSLEDCVADWGDTELCEREMKEAREHAEKMAKAQGGTSSASFIPIFMGPSYSGSDRSYRTSDGRTITPHTTSSTRTANYTQAPGGGRVVSYTSPNHAATRATTSRSTGGSSFGNSTSRGGIGATGASSGSVSS